MSLPACQLPTGSSPCASLSANSSIMLRSYSSIVSILSPWMPAMRSLGHPFFSKVTKRSTAQLPVRSQCSPPGPRQTTEAP